MNKPCLAALCALTLLPACATGPTDGGLGSSCPIRMSTLPGPGGEGVVVKILSQEEAMSLLAKTESQVGAPIDGVYINNVRAVLRKPDGERATVVIPYGMILAPGDRIAFQGSYRRPDLPCSYVPNLATRKL